MTNNLRTVKYFPFGEYVETNPVLKNLPKEIVIDRFSLHAPIFHQDGENEWTTYRDDFRLRKVEEGCEVFIRGAFAGTVAEEMDAIAICAEYSRRVPYCSKQDNAVSLNNYIKEIGTRIGRCTIAG